MHCSKVQCRFYGNFCRSVQFLCKYLCFRPGSEFVLLEPGILLADKKWDESSMQFLVDFLQRILRFSCEKVCVDVTGVVFPDCAPDAAVYV